jgi:hypothetical protein
MIPSHPSHEVKDSSKLIDFLHCKRYYFYRYILGWRLDTPVHDLHFGEAYHKAREYQLRNGYDDVEGAFNAFLECYREYFGPEEDGYYNPKSPDAVYNALLKFATEKHRDLIDNEVVILDGQKMLEISGTVPISETRFLHYRLDSIMRRLKDGKIFSWDHKTTSEKYILGRQWSDQFFLSTQNGTYNHCLYCMFPIEDVLGVEFCGTGFAYLSRGSANRPAGYYVTLQRVPAFKSPDQMNTWLWTVNDIYDTLEFEERRLLDCSENDDTMMAFPMDHTFCTGFKGCPYLDYCIAWQNPLQFCDEPPLGMTVEFWDPRNVKTSVTKDLTIGG